MAWSPTPPSNSSTAVQGWGVTVPAVNTPAQTGWFYPWNVAPPAAAVTATALAPSITVNNVLPVPTMTAAAQMLAPSVSVYIPVAPPPMAATAQALAPTISIQSIIAPPAMAATGQMLVPGVGTGIILSPPTATVTATALAPAVAVTSVVAPPAMTATAGLLTPGVTVIIPIAPPVAAATATAQSPTVSVVSPAVAYDSTGAGYAGTSATPSFAHTIGAGANAAVVFVSILSTSSAAHTPTVKVGTTAMTQLPGGLNTYFTQNYLFTNYYVSLLAFALKNPPTGAQTVAVSGFNSGSLYLCINSESYSNVTSFGTVATANGTTTSAALSVPSAVRQMVAQAFTAGEPSSSSGSFSAYSQTQHYNQPFASSNNLALVMGDAPGAASVSFTATIPSGLAEWGGIGVPLIP